MENIVNSLQHLGIQYNVTLKVIDQVTGETIQEHIGHNCATNSMLYGIAHHLVGDSIWNQGWYMLQQYVPKYISLGTMGLVNQDCDSDGLPTGLGSSSGTEAEKLQIYLTQVPGYGSDGYDTSQMNGRAHTGLGPKFTTTAVDCELITDNYPRFPITHREIVPESQSEIPRTIDVVYSAMISTGALKQFRGNNDYVFITEAGLWSRSDWVDNTGENGLLAGYRLAPSDYNESWDLSNPDNQEKIKRSVLRVGLNQVVVVIWKLQLGSIAEFSNDI